MDGCLSKSFAILTFGSLDAVLRRTTKSNRTWLEALTQALQHQVQMTLIKARTAAAISYCDTSERNLLSSPGCIVSMSRAEILFTKERVLVGSLMFTQLHV